MAQEGMPVESPLISQFPVVVRPTRRIPVEIGEFDDRPQDECGVVAVYDPDGPVLQRVRTGMDETHHRGHSGAGIGYLLHADTPFSTLVTHKGAGTIEEAVPEIIDNNVFSLDGFQEHIRTPLAIGHVRYSTAEANNWMAAHPFRGEKTSLLLATNGHIDNVPDIARTLDVELPDDPSETDTSQLTYVIDAIAARTGGLDESLQEVLPLVEGSYSLVMIDGEDLVAARDAWGFHPLALGTLESGGYALASESVAFEPMGASFVRDVEPGEIIRIGKEGLTSSFIDRVEKSQHCAFEFIYTARPDGMVDGVNVEQSRINQGYYLGIDQPAPGADVVIGVPNSGRPAAQGYAAATGLEYRDDIVVKVNSTRTFQERGDERDKMIEWIYGFQENSLVGQTAVVVDDSMIKGSTMKAFARKFVEHTGAAGLHLRFAAAPYKNACYMGMDTHDESRLISRSNTPEQIVGLLNMVEGGKPSPNVLSVAFNTPQRIEQAVLEALVEKDQLAKFGGLCLACATGEYPINVDALKPVELPMPTVRAGRLALTGA